MNDEIKLSDDADEAINLLMQANGLRKKALDKLNGERERLVGLLNFVDSQIHKLKWDAAEREIYNKVSDEGIIEYLEEEKTTGDVMEKFGFSTATVGKRLNQLLKDKKIILRKSGTSKFWLAKI